MLDRRQVYLDNSAATRLDERVLEAMKPYLFDKYAVATSEFAYSQGIEAREVLDGAREALALAMGAAPGEFIFTSGSTESSNIALKGVALALGNGEPRVRRRRDVLWALTHSSRCQQTFEHVPPGTRRRPIERNQSGIGRKGERDRFDFAFFDTTAGTHDQFPDL